MTVYKEKIEETSGGGGGYNFQKIKKLVDFFDFLWLVTLIRKGSQNNQ